MLLLSRLQSRFRSRVSGDPTGAPEWVRDIASVGEGPGWFEPDGVVWRTDLPTTEAELAEALASYAPVLEPVPADLRAFLTAPPGLSRPEQLFYAGLSAGAARLVSPTIAPLARVPGRTPGWSVALRAVALQLRALQVALGRYSPSEQAARYRLGTGPAPTWLAVRSGA